MSDKRKASQQCEFCRRCPMPEFITGNQSSRS